MIEYSEKINPAAQVQRMIADTLRDNQWFIAKKCTIIEQDSAELRQLLLKGVMELEGPVVIVGVDGLRNNRPAMDVDIRIAVTEVVMLNRIDNDFATALEVAQAAVDVLDGNLWGWQEISHEVPQDGVFVATATFKGSVVREDD